MILAWINQLVGLALGQVACPGFLANIPGCADGFWLLARRHDLRGLSEGFRGRSIWDNAPQTVFIALIILIMAMTLLAIGRYANRYGESHASNNPTDLFRELCRIHHLAGGDRRLLKRLAACWELESPGLLFIQPERFEAARLPIELQSEAENVARLRTHLFGDAQ